MTEIAIVWFDFGGVLSPPIPELFEQYYRKTGIPSAALQGAMKSVADDLGVPMLAPIENAMLTEMEWGRRIKCKLKESVPNVDLGRADFEFFGKQWFEGVLPNKAMIDSVHALKRSGMDVGILTNNVVEWEPYWRAVLGLDGVVDHIVDSSKERCRKPELQFYEIACQRADVRSFQCLLIDDVKENVVAARSLGWNAVHFTNNRSAMEQIEWWTKVNVMDAHTVPTS